MLRRGGGRVDVVSTCAEAAFRPSPLEPPVTTATLPLRLKRDGKSLILTSSMMALGVRVRYYVGRSAMWFLYM